MFVRMSVAALAAIVLTQAAQAADMFVKAPVASWTGFYVGVNAGYGWGSSDPNFTGEPGGGAGNDFVSRIFTGVLNFSPNTATQTLDANGAIGGVQFGYNWQFAPAWVAGLEADIQVSGVTGDATTTSPAVSLRLDSESKLKWFGTLRGRLGYLVSGNVLVFGTGGLAYGAADVNSTITSATGFFANGATTITCVAGSVCMIGEESKVTAGWTLGAGAEWAVASNVTVKGEYLHIDLGHQSVLMTTQAPSSGSGTITADFHNSFDIVRTGVNLRF